jgi:hypothetical protein
MAQYTNKSMFEKYSKVLGVIGDACRQDSSSWKEEYTQKSGLTIDPNIGEMSIDGQQLELTGKIDSSAIEEAVLKILNKYNVYIPASHEVSVGYSAYPMKTFTLDEVIKIIESVDKRLNLNVHGIWENHTEDLIDRDKLIQKFKSL